MLSAWTIIVYNLSHISFDVRKDIICTVIMLTTVWEWSECPARPRIQCGRLRAAATTVRFVPAPSAIALRAISSIPWS